MPNKFDWIPFYEALADRLLKYKDRRNELFELMKKLSEEQSLMKYLHFDREDWWGTQSYMIDPFSVIGVLNRKVRAADSRSRGIAALFEKGRVFRSSFIRSRAISGNALDEGVLPSFLGGNGYLTKPLYQRRFKSHF